MKEVDGIKALTFWDHLDELRGCLVRIAIVTVACGLAWQHSFLRKKCSVSS